MSYHSTKLPKRSFVKKGRSAMSKRGEAVKDIGQSHRKLSAKYPKVSKRKTIE